MDVTGSACCEFPVQAARSAPAFAVPDDAMMTRGRGTPSQDAMTTRKENFRYSSSFPSTGLSSFPMTRPHYRRRFDERDSDLFPSSYETTGDWRTTMHQMIGVHALIGSRSNLSAVEPVPRDGTTSGSLADVEAPGETGSESMQVESRCSTSCSRAEAAASALQRLCTGLSHLSPWLDQLLDSPSSLSQSIFLLVAFVLTSTGRFVMSDLAHDAKVNYFSLIAVTNAVSLLTSLLTSFAFEGSKAWKLIFHWGALWRFAAVAFLFAGSQALQIVSHWRGTTPFFVVTVGYLYLPVVVIMSYFVFNRHYGKLEWLAVGMMTMSVLTFVVLREQHHDLEMRLKSAFTPAGFAMVVGAVVVSAGASIFSERIYKKESWGLKLWEGNFYIMKVQLDATALFLSVVLWGTRQMVIGRQGAVSNMLSQWSVVQDLFGEWSASQVLLVAISVAYGWAAGLVTKEHSTTFKSIVETIFSIFCMLVDDPVLGSRWGFQKRMLPSLLLTGILVLSAVVFQTGRQNVKVLERAAAMVLRHPSDTGGSTGRVQSFNKVSNRVSPDALKALVSSCKKACRKNIIFLLYIFAYAVRNLVQQKALGSIPINPLSLSLIVYMIQVVIASCLTLRFEGCKVLGEAWHPRKIWKCLPAGFLFALTTALNNIAMSQGLSAALTVIIGKFYTPTAAIGARCVLGKYYMWLEYVALAILTLACMTFGYLQAFSPGRHSAWVENENMKVSMLLVFGSAVAAAFNSLLTERILKGDKAAFHVQKVSLDTSCILSTLVLIPLAGVISQRAQDIPWAARPVEHSCPADSVCWQTGGCALAGCDCACGTGLFAGWMTSTASVLVLALVINTVYGWLVGMLVQEFSTVDRAIADSFSLLAVYFLGDPLLNGSSLGNVSLDLVAFIVPMSTSIFAVAASEMQRVADLLSVQDTAAEDHP
eukprot:TRINITY_DN15258_c0_g1_i2.p1 TRINITY_DN15258_c0_g1~~TRINITY_DN15258_c0_g1_i2.p1  ORF type:complete len:931 (-),score=148.53 TRINITY_DN15258_c0_g1_i2:70-2862(-)